MLKECLHLVSIKDILLILNHQKKKNIIIFSGFLIFNLKKIKKSFYIHNIMMYEVNTFSMRSMFHRSSTSDIYLLHIRVDPWFLQ